MSMLSPFAILRQLRLGKESSTFERLGRSRHVADLRLIFSVTVILMIVGVIAALAFWPEHTKRLDMTEKRTKRGRVGAILQAGQRVAPFRRWRCGLVSVTGIT
jgi:hypothetical protein